MIVKTQWMKNEISLIKKKRPGELSKLETASVHESTYSTLLTTGFNRWRNLMSLPIHDKRKLIWSSGYVLNY